MTTGSNGNGAGSSIRWVVTVPTATGLELYRLAPLGAGLEFLAPDRQTAERMLTASGVSLPDDARLISRIEYDELQRTAPQRYAAVRRLPRPASA